MSTSTTEKNEHDLPLTGLNVIELHAIGPVPFAGMHLQSMGASVTRISPLQDPGLGIGLDPQFDVLNAGKTVRRMDLKSEKGKTELAQLLAQADVMLEGFRPGVLERLGMSPTTLANDYPQLVLGRLSGWGENGDLSKRAGHDINYLAMAGVLNAIGTDKEPIAPLNLVADFGGGAMTLLLGVLAKLVQRGISGRGGVASTSILAGTIGLSPMFYGLLASGQWTIGRAQNLLDGGAPFYRLYETQCGGHVAVGALEAKFFALLLQVTDLQNEVDASKQYQTDTWPRMAELLARQFNSKPRDEWATLCADVDCCVSPVLDFLEASRHPHNQANDWYAQTPFARPKAVINFS